MYIKKRYH